MAVIRPKSTSKPESSILDSASDYFGALRWRAANALTASLAPDERESLLEKLDSSRGSARKQNQDDSSGKLVEEKEAGSNEHVPQISIAEAVAAARAQEAKLQTEKWEKEKGRLMEEAERAAMQRVESDIAIQKRRLAFEAWKKDLEKEVSKQPTESKDAPAPELTQAQSQDHHPVLGPVVADLGTKRIHLVSADALSAIPVWEKQRIYRHGRAKAMANDKLKSLKLGLPGIIGIYEVRGIYCLYRLTIELA